MRPLSPALFIAAASALVSSPDIADAPEWKYESDPVMRDRHQTNDIQGTAAFVAHVGYWAHYRAGSSEWPFPVTADVNELARIATDKHIIGDHRSLPGDLCLRWSAVEKRFVRASIVLNCSEAIPSADIGWWYECLVIEGSASVGDEPPFASRVQWARRAATTCAPSLGDRFVSWVELDGRNDAARGWAA